MQPLMCMLVVNVREVATGVKDAELHMVIQIAVVDVRRVVRIEDARRFGEARLERSVRRIVADFGGVAHGPRLEKELLELAVDAVLFRPGTEQPPLYRSRPR